MIQKLFRQLFAETDDDRIVPQNLPESIVWYSLISTYGVYCLGGLYILGPALAWILLAYIMKEQWVRFRDGQARYPLSLHWILWLWVGGMGVEFLALYMGHMNFNLSLTTTIKSSIGWARGWALMAIFPIVGSCLAIRPQLLFRGACVVALHSLLVAPFLYAAYSIDWQPLLYTSPLKVVGGAGDLFFQVRLYSIDGEGNPRWSFFCPWGPAAGMMGNIYFFLSLQEKNLRWRFCGLAGSLLLVWMSRSRMATLFLIVVYVSSWIIRTIHRPKTLFALGTLSVVSGLSAPILESVLWNYWQQFHSTRAGSSRVRSVLQRIAIRRWRNEAPIWGHGTVDEGPHLVEYMPIGSHHTIFSLLFVKGIVGLIAFLVPMLVTTIALGIKAQRNTIAATALSVILLLCCYTWGENIESLAYLYWPGLVLIGMVFVSDIPKSTPAKQISV
ncbi:MAG: O-antigen ligase domain-containing protein [Cyanobacteria bacterium P01_F01_bin.150]